MPWNASYYPASMKHLPPEVREKAIEIANALLEEGMEEGVSTGTLAHTESSSRRSRQ